MSDFCNKNIEPVLNVCSFLLCGFGMEKMGGSLCSIVGCFYCHLSWQFIWGGRKKDPVQLKCQKNEQFGTTTANSMCLACINTTLVQE